MPQAPRRIVAEVPGTPGLEPINQALYDAETYPAAGVAQLVFFRDVTGKQLDQTNQTTSGSLPNPQQFHIYGLQIIPGFTDQTFFDPATANNAVDNLAAIYEAGFCRLVVGDKAYVEENLQFIPSGHGLAGFAAIDNLGAAGGVVSAHPGVAHENNYKDTTVKVGRKRRPIHVPPQQHFRVELNFPTAPAVPSGDPILFFVRLLGIKFREVQ